jgi:hypothetical protein
MTVGGNLERMLRGQACRLAWSPGILVDVDFVTVDQFARLSITLRNMTTECVLR